MTSAETFEVLSNQQKLSSMTQVEQGVFITDELFLPRYVWHKMKFDLPLIREKVGFFEAVTHVFKDVQELYNAGSAKLKHLGSMQRTFGDLRTMIGTKLFNDAKMLDLGKLISENDETMQRINTSYGSSGSSMANPI